MDDLERILRAQPFLADLEPDHVRFLVGCARNVRFLGNEYLEREGDLTHALYLIRQGSVIIEIRRPGEPIGIETVGPGDVLGVSSMLAVSEHFDCRARDTVLALALDSQCVLRKMVEDPRLGHAISMRLLERTYQRLARARLQHLDVYR